MQCFMLLCVCLCSLNSIDIYGFLYLLGEWAWIFQVWTWGNGGGHAEGSHRGTGVEAGALGPEPEQSTGSVRGGCVHSDGHHLWAHHGSG